MASFDRFFASERYEHKFFLGNSADNRGAFPLHSKIDFEVDAPVNTVSADMILICDDNGKTCEFAMSKKGKRFCVTLDTSSLSGEDGALYFYKYRFKTTAGDFEMRRRTLDYSEEIVDARDGFENAFQLLIYKKRKKYPEFMRDAVMYQIFPDRFCRSKKAAPREDAVVQEPGEIPIYPERGKKFKNNNFFLGDLWGIAEKLDYIADLGVNIIYLNPIFKAYSNHRYDTGDYMKIDEMLGGDKAFSHFLKEAKKRGIRIILDGVFNHTGDDSVYFNRSGNYPSVGAYQSKESPYYTWYNFRKFPNDYECWWGFKSLPRVNCDHPDYREFICGKNGVVRKYIKEGVSGWRLDVADELSDGFLQSLKTAALAQKSDAVIIGEVWEDASNKTAYGARKKYFRGSELDGVMNYPCRTAVINYLRDGDFLGLIRTFRRIYGNYPPESANCSMNILGTHDTERILTALAGEPAAGRTKAELSKISLDEEQIKRGKALLRLAFVMTAALPGVPCIYYGDEAGMEGYDDPLCRAFFPWGREDEKLVSFFARVGKARRKEKIFEDGEMCVRFADADVACFERIGDSEALAVLVNRSCDEYEFISSGAEEILSGVSGKKLTIAPMSAGIFKIKKDGSYSVLKKIEAEE